MLTWAAGAGLISSWFVQDITLDRRDARARHIIQAVGSSSAEKGKAFVARNVAAGNQSCPSIYTSYQQVYDDPQVSVVYIGTPHALHKQNCLDAIAAGKHVLCEKPFTVNAREAREVLAAAKVRGVFVMEAMWTRFTPLVAHLREKLFQEKIIGDVRRVFCDFGLDMDLESLGSDSRLKNPALGAGSLLDIGIYSLTWGLLSLEGEPHRQKPHIASIQTLKYNIDTASSILLLYPSTGRQAILTSTTEAKTDMSFCHIEGTEGSIQVYGLAASMPSSYTVYPKNVISATDTIEKHSPDSGSGSSSGGIPVDGQRFDFPQSGRGFYFEADAVALDIAANRLENGVMPHAETLRVMEMMDQIRLQGGARFPQDEDK